MWVLSIPLAPPQEAMKPMVEFLENTHLPALTAFKQKNEVKIVMEIFNKSHSKKLFNITK